jgi:hypothetical protein
MCEIFSIDCDISVVRQIKALIYIRLRPTDSFSVHCHVIRVAHAQELSCSSSTWSPTWKPDLA